MACGIRENFNTNIGLSTTGIAGPGGGNKNKKVGLVYTGIVINNNKYTFKHNFKGTRKENRWLTSQHIFFNLIKLLEN